MIIYFHTIDNYYITTPNQMNKRPREYECDDAALLPSIKKPHTDFSNNSDKSTSTPEKAKPEGMDLSSKWLHFLLIEHVTLKCIAMPMAAI